MLGVVICTAPAHRCAQAIFPARRGPEAAAAQLELASGWRLASARDVDADGATVSRPDYQDSAWHRVRTMPATVLQALQDDGTYPNLYYGTNLLDEVPQDLYQQDWWYRTTFDAPAGHSTYQLNFPGINYRAEVWLNGHLVADDDQIVGMYVAHELDVTRWIQPGEPNTLAVRVTPERALQDVDGVELADSWYDWINWNYLGYQGPGKNPANGNSFVADRNAGIWKPVTLRMSGPVAIGDATVNTELPLPDTDSARLSVYSRLQNFSTERMRGVLRATITRPGRDEIRVEQPVTLAPGETREVGFRPDGIRRADADQSRPVVALHDGRSQPLRPASGVPPVRPRDGLPTLRFGIRTVSQLRDDDERFPELGHGGSFYLKVNGRDFLVRGAAYTPDLLFDDDPDREDAILRYTRTSGSTCFGWSRRSPPSASCRWPTSWASR